MSKGFRITVEDLNRGESQSMVVGEGDYMFIPFEPCYLAHVQKMGKGTYQLTVKGHAPIPVESSEAGEPDGTAD